MSRLLFAAARGARVQRQQEAMHSNRTWWEDVPIQWGMDDELRIHSDDLHLQYGPISTALRAWAFLNESGVDPEYIFAARVICEEIEPDWFAQYDDEFHRSLFLLLLSEALADEGL
jgi:hypothetical protein